MDPDLPAGVLLLPSWAKVGAGARSWDSPKTGICPSAFGFLPSVSSSLVSLFFFFFCSLSPLFLSGSSLSLCPLSLSLLVVYRWRGGGSYFERWMAGEDYD
jgi:hypothetical protein